MSSATAAATNAAATASAAAAPPAAAIFLALSGSLDGVTFLVSFGRNDQSQQFACAGVLSFKFFGTRKAPGDVVFTLFRWIRSYMLSSSSYLALDRSPG